MQREEGDRQECKDDDGAIGDPPVYRRRGGLCRTRHRSLTLQEPLVTRDEPQGTEKAQPGDELELSRYVGSAEREAPSSQHRDRAEAEIQAQRHGATDDRFEQVKSTFADPHGDRVARNATDAEREDQTRDRPGAEPSRQYPSDSGKSQCQGREFRAGLEGIDQRFLGGTCDRGPSQPGPDDQSHESQEADGG